MMNKKIEEEAERKRLKIERVKKILKESGIRMYVGACGCCNSPWVTFEKDGELILNDEEFCDFSMFEED